jgi:arylsulfatase A-like enzyme
VATEKEEYSHDLIAQEGLDFVRRSHQQPFFLYWALTLPHANNEAGQAGMEVPDQGIYKDRDWPENRKNMAAMVSRMDRDVGRLLDLLKELGIEQNTLVIFTSDNGPHKEGGNDPTWFDSNGPWRGIKRDLYEGGIRVPFVARWTGTIKAGTTSDHVSAFWDFLPTAAELAGASLPDHLDGISYVNALVGNGVQQETHDYLYWEFTEQGGKQAVREGDWKGIRLNVSVQPDGPLELYNLAEDPGETLNLAAEYPEIVASLAMRMAESHTESSLFPLAGR